MKARKAESPNSRPMAISRAASRRYPSLWKSRCQTLSGTGLPAWRSSRIARAASASSVMMVRSDAAGVGAARTRIRAESPSNDGISSWDTPVTERVGSANAGLLRGRGRRGPVGPGTRGGAGPRGTDRRGSATVGPQGQAGGFVELRRLREGAWVPRSWRLRAPQAVRSAGSSRLRLKRWLEKGGRVTAVRTADGALDSVSTAELLSESR